MSKLAADLLVPVPTPAEDDSRLGSLKVTDAPSTNGRDGGWSFDDLHGLDGRAGTTSAMTMCLTGMGRGGDARVGGERGGEVGGRVDGGEGVSCGVGPSGQAAGLSGERWGAPPVVAATKLTIPRSRRPLVPRPVEPRLDEDYRLALVSAPAGYGKTAALATWAAGHRDRVAWLSCDPSMPSRHDSCRGCWRRSRRVAWRGRRRLRAAGRDGANIYDAAAAVANELATIGDRV